jgi:hypothetical protein
MVQKKLQKESQYESLDMNNDGIVDDNELAVMQALDIHEKNDSQKRMAWVAMIAMLVFTAFVFLPIFPDSRINALSDLFSLFYIGMAGVVAAYFGAEAFANKKK